MKRPDHGRPEEPDEENSRAETARRVLEEYANELRVWLDRLRKMLK